MEGRSTNAFGREQIDFGYDFDETQGNYGMITVDFKKKLIRAGIKTPADGNEEAYIEFSYSSAKDCKRLLLYPSILLNLLVLFNP